MLLILYYIIVLYVSIEECSKHNYAWSKFHPPTIVCIIRTATSVGYVSGKGKMDDGEATRVIRQT